MSKKGDCFDNAAMESWNGSFKVEAIHGEKLDTRAEVKNMCSNIWKCIIIGKVFIRNLAILALSHLRKEKLLSEVPVFLGKDQVAVTSVLPAGLSLSAAANDGLSASKFK